VTLGKTVLLRAPQADVGDFEAFVLSSPVYESASHAILSRIPSKENRDDLASRFAKAQASFMEGSMIQAAEDFKSVTSLAETDQWGSEEQNVLLHSFFRLAQITHDPQESEDWLKRAVVWTPKGEPAEKFFPPPLIEKWKTIKDSFPMVKMDLQPYALDFDYVLINGRVVPLSDTTQLTVPNGPVRATFISDAFQPITVETQADQLSVVRIDKKPWVEGSCLKPQLHWQQSGQIVKPFFSRHCAPLKSPPKVDVEVAYHEAPLEIPIAPTTPLETNSTKSSTPLYHRTWFWLGIGAVATAVVVASLSKHETQPTAHDGF